MALHFNKSGKVQIVTPPKKLTNKEREILKNTPINKKLIDEAMKINFNVVYGW